VDRRRGALTIGNALGERIGGRGRMASGRARSRELDKGRSATSAGSAGRRDEDRHNSELSRGAPALSLPPSPSLSLSLSLNIFHSRKGFLSPGMEEVEAVGAPRTRVPAFSRAPQICQALHACLLDTGRLIALRRSVDTLARDAVAEPWERSR